MWSAVRLFGLVPIALTGAVVRVNFAAIVIPWLLNLAPPALNRITAG